MAITKTNFVNYSRCRRYTALDEIKREKFDSSLSYDEYKREEENEMIKELLSGMYGIDEETGEEVDLIDTLDEKLESMLPYYKKIEELAGTEVLKLFGGKIICAEETHNQQLFDFNRGVFKYMCYVDVYNEVKDKINIVEVKATTSRKFYELGTKISGEFYSIFEKIGNIYTLKDEITGYDIESEFGKDKYLKIKQKLFDRYGVGKYVFDLAIQRFIIEGEYKQSNNQEKLKNIKYYLGVLNHEYCFDGTYQNGEAVYNQDINGNSVITLIDLTKTTQEYLEYVNRTADSIEENLLNLNPNSCSLGTCCEKGKPSECKFFKTICSKIIPKYNSSLSYRRNIGGFKTESGDTLKGLDIINNGYYDLLDIPESWIHKKNYFIQRECYKEKKDYINKKKIKDILEKIEYPIYHLDFETLNCPLPRFRGEYPYTQSPFEFSLHIEQSPGVCDKDKDNFVFLAKNHEDCREDLIKAMLKYIDGNKGTMLAQNVSFEKGRIKELATSFPEYREELMKIYNRAFDLLWVVETNTKMYEDMGYEKEEAQEFNFYDYRLSGSFSIKKTLPVFSNLSYSDLEVKNGNEAMVEYANYSKMDEEEFNKKYNALVEYCKQDTWAMVEILNAIRKRVDEKVSSR